MFTGGVGVDVDNNCVANLKKDAHLIVSDFFNHARKF